MNFGTILYFKVARSALIDYHRFNSQFAVKAPIFSLCFSLVRAASAGAVNIIKLDSFFYFAFSNSTPTFSLSLG